MRVALLHYSSPPVIGGVERVLEKHAHLFALGGHEVTIICGTREALATETRVPSDNLRNPGLSSRPVQYEWSASGHIVPDRPITFITIPELTPSHPGVKDVQADLMNGKAGSNFDSLISKLATELRPLLVTQDIVMLHNVCTMPFHLALTAALWELSESIPTPRFVCWVHDVAAMNPDYHIPHFAPWDLLRRSSARFEYVAVSELRQRQICELTGLDIDACKVVPNGLDPTQELGLSQNVARLTCMLNLLERDIVLFQPTRLLRRKNVELSLKVLSALKTKGQNCLLLITGAPDPHNAGSAAYANRVVALRSELNLQDDCYFLGELFEVLDEDVSSFYRVADALFFPSHQEGFGLPMLEAALHRIPAFCTDVEPLAQLPGAIPFDRSATPDEIAAMIIRQIHAWPANLPRKAIARNYAWPVVYRNCLAPLLKRYKDSEQP